MYFIFSYFNSTPMSLFIGLIALLFYFHFYSFFPLLLSSFLFVSVFLVFLPIECYSHHFLWVSSSVLCDLRNIGATVRDWA